MTNKERIARLGRFPVELEAVVGTLDDERLDTPYGPGKWTVRQLVHHLADSHMNAFIRMKLIVTETNPLLRCYEQTDWAKTADGASGDIAPSLNILRGLHLRWCVMLNSLDDGVFEQTAQHPELGPVTLQSLVEDYYNHCDNHLKHITDLLASKGW